MKDNEKDREIEAITFFPTLALSKSGYKGIISACYKAPPKFDYKITYFFFHIK